jgi:hypothetical protein
MAYDDGQHGLAQRYLIQSPPSALGLLAAQAPASAGATAPPSHDNRSQSYDATRPVKP